MDRHILHLDMDTFFVSVERLHRPELRGKPVVVGAESPHCRGVVSAASYEARRYGIHSGMALRQAGRLCPQAVFVAGRGEAYSAASRDIRLLCEETAPLVEMGSMEEAYLDLTGTERLYPSAGAAADQLQARIHRELNLPVSFGWGENKLLAKVASGRSKPEGLLRVYPGRGRAFLAPLPLRRLPGIGPKNAALLSRYGLERIGQLEWLGEKRLREALGEIGGQLYRRSLGQDDSPVVPRPERKSISREHTFATDTANRDSLARCLSLLCEKLAADARRLNCFGRRLTLKLRYSDFTTLTRCETLAQPDREDRLLYHRAWALLEKAWTRRVRIRLLGVALSDLTADCWTLDLFTGADREKGERLAFAVDRLRERYGFPSILRGRSLE